MILGGSETLLTCRAGSQGGRQDGIRVQPRGWGDFAFGVGAARRFLSGVGRERGERWGTSTEHCLPPSDGEANYG